MARSSIRSWLVVGLVTGMAGVGGAQAQEPLPSAAGARIRVTAPAVSGRRLVGTLIGMDGTRLTLRADKGKGTLEVPRNAITRLEVSRHRSRKGKGAGIGALIGIGAAVILGVAAGDDCNFPPARPEDLDLVERLDRNLCFGKGEMALAASIVTVPLATLLGYAAAPGERWIATSPDRLRVAVAPVRGGGVRGSLAVRF